MSQSLNPDIGTVVARRASGMKIPWVAHVSAAGQLVVIVIGVSERRPAINQRPHQIQNQASMKEVWVLVLGFFMFLSAVSAGSA